MQRLAFYHRRGRQRCKLRHVMPLYHVHPLFTTRVIGVLHVIGNNENHQMDCSNSNVTPWIPEGVGRGAHYDT
ncbi:hypothetical protein SFRURICE_008702 [Spodoptera frugiperda]|uniref:SFRICE_021264 n=1 Tax=Spodoptera frugiperda TaxID=7108 RepID=A0A2H1WK35_SPOFR|nr:hypothetical protein SFRURICE_008702 [Spodoptera frugiperda]